MTTGLLVTTNKRRRNTPKNDLQERAQAILTREIRFTYAAEFESLASLEIPVAETEALLSRLQSPQPRHEFSAQANADRTPTDLRDWTTTDPLLTAEEEQTLFRTMNLLRYRVNQLRAKLSDRSPSGRILDEIDLLLDLADRIRTQLVNSNVRLVSSIARKFGADGADVDEFSSDGCMVLMSAIDRFDYSRGFRFSTYATHSIQRHIFRTWKTRQRRKSRVASVAPEFLAEHSEKQGDPPICLDPQQTAADLMRRAGQVLDAREIQIVCERFGLQGNAEGSTLREIADELGLSKERIRQLQEKALDKLRGLVSADLLTD